MLYQTVQKTIARQYRRGLGLEAIAAETGFPVRFVRACVAASGVPVRTQGRPRKSVLMWPEMAAAYRAGVPVKEIAQRFGVTLGGAYSRLRRMGTPMQRRGTWARDPRHPARDAAILAAFQQGDTAAQIARAVGISRERVRQILRRQGSPTKHPVVQRQYIAGCGCTVRNEGVQKCADCRAQARVATWDCPRCARPAQRGKMRPMAKDGIWQGLCFACYHQLVTYHGYHPSQGDLPPYSRYMRRVQP